MRIFNRNIPDGERDDEVGPIQPASPQVDLSRRGFLSAAMAALILSSCAGEDEEDNSPKKPEIVTAETIAEKYDLDSLRKMLIRKYSGLGSISTKTIKNEDGTISEVEEINPKFRQLGMKDEYQDDILVQAYFLKVTYEDMFQDKLLSKADSVSADDYLHPEKKMWPKKLRIIDKDHRKDMEVALANLTEADEKNPSEKMDYQKFIDLADKVVTDVTARMNELKKAAQEKLDSAQKDYAEQPTKDNQFRVTVAQNKFNKYDLINDFTSLIDSDFLVGLSIHEIMPTGKEDLNPKGYSDLMRIALLRTLFDEGFEINKVPAQWDDVASFGTMQMSVMPYEGRNRDNPFGAETELRNVNETYTDKKGRKKKKKVLKEFDLVGDIEPYLADCNLPHQLCECIELEDQLKAGMLLLLTNFKSLFKELLTENERFIGIWNSSSLIERRTFLATIMGTAHNNPRNAKRSLEQAIGWNRSQKDSADYFLDDNKSTKEEITNLTELRTAYINIAKHPKKGHPVSGREGEETSSLVERFSKYNVDSETTVLATSTPVPSPQDTMEPDSVDTASLKKPLKVTEKAEIHRELKLLKRERDGFAYFTFDLPNWKLAKVAELLCGNSTEGTMEAIRKINKIDKFKPGDVILIPVQFMKPELQNPALVEIKIPKGKNKEEYLRDIMKDGSEPDIALIYNSTKPAASDLNDLPDLIRVPKSLIK